MKKVVLTVVVAFGFILSANSQFQDVDDMRGYCQDLAYRGAELEYADGRKDYFTAYYEWFELCMGAHGQN